MKLRYIVPVLGLAALLTVGCAQSTLAADSDRDVAAVETTEVSECAAKAAECSEAQKADCSEAQKAECAEKKKECPVSGGDVN